MGKKHNNVPSCIKYIVRQPCKRYRVQSFHHLCHRLFSRHTLTTYTIWSIFVRKFVVRRSPRAKHNSLQLRYGISQFLSSVTYTNMCTFRTFRTPLKILDRWNIFRFSSFLILFSHYLWHSLLLFSFCSILQAPYLELRHENIRLIAWNSRPDFAMIRTQLKFCKSDWESERES